MALHDNSSVLEDDHLSELLTLTTLKNTTLVVSLNTITYLQPTYGELQEDIILTDTGYPPTINLAFL